MKEYIPREDALNFELSVTAAPSEFQAISQGMSLYAEHIKAIPAADVVEVVRCRECRYYEIVQLRKDGEDDHRYKPSVCVLGKYAEYRKPEWYCADGKRRNEA